MKTSATVSHEEDHPQEHSMIKVSVMYPYRAGARFEHGLLPSATALFFLALLGAVAARAGGAGVLGGAWRVTFWGALAMAITAGVGALFGAVV